MEQWSPWTAARNLDVDVVWLPPHLDVDGIYFPRRGIIGVRRGMTRAMTRSVLAEELAHAELGHEPHPDPIETARMEFRARRTAARRLMSLHKLREAMVGAERLDEVAERLDVDPELVRIRLEDL